MSCVKYTEIDKALKAYGEWSNGVYNQQQDKEKEYLTKLIDDHWKYIEGVITKSVETYTNQIDESALKEIEYHYKTAFEHGWRHAKEYFTGSV